MYPSHAAEQKDNIILGLYQKMEKLMSNKDNGITALDQVINNVGLQFGKQTRTQAHSTQTCQRCGNSATNFKDAISQKEYQLTAWCQKCQDAFFG